MRPVVFEAELASGHMASFTGFPTSTPGLVVHEPYSACGEGRCWRVSYARAGWAIGKWCWSSPEGAVAFAQALGGYTDWQQPPERLLVALKGRRAPINDFARNLNGTSHREAYQPRRRSGPFVDNGVIA